MNLLDLRKFIFALSVMKLIALFFSIPFFSANRFLGFNKFILLLKISLKIVIQNHLKVQINLEQALY